MTRAKFAPTSDSYLFSRDYLAVKIWDVRKNNQPVQTFNTTDYLDVNLCDLYENERIYDKFDLQISPCSTMALTGSYNSNAHVIDLQRRINTTIDVRFLDKRGKYVGVARNYKNRRLNMNMLQAVSVMSRAELERRDLVSYKQRLLDEQSTRMAAEK